MCKVVTFLLFRSMTTKSLLSLGKLQVWARYCYCYCWVTPVVSDSVRPRPWDSPGRNTGVGCHFLLQCTKLKSESEVAQACLTLRDPMDCSPPGSSIHGIFQARGLEWGATAFSVEQGRHLQILELGWRKRWVMFVPSLKSLLYQLLVVWPWVSYNILPHFLFCWMGMINSTCFIRLYLELNKLIHCVGQKFFFFFFFS